MAAPVLLAAVLTGLWPALGRGAWAQAAMISESITPPAQPEAGPAEARPSRLMRVRRQLEEILRGATLKKARVGVVVLDGQTGEELFSHEADKPFNPASNTKILSTAAALSTLGVDYRYPTWLLGPPPKTGTDAIADEDGVIHGDVFVQGSGDPSLSPTGLADLARDLARRGVRRIDGEVHIDNLFRDRRALEETASPPSFGPGALLIDRDVYRVHVHSGTVGKNASAWIEPRSPYFELRNAVRTVRGKKARVFVDHHRNGDHLVVTVRGRIGSQHSALSIKKRMADSTAWAALTLSQALADFGVEVRGGVRAGPPPKGPLHVLAEHTSLPLSEICRVVNKDSNNFVADTLFKTLGAVKFGLPGTLEKGKRAVEEWLSAFGLPAARVHIVNGSGLTHENRVRPGDLARLLLSLYHDPGLGPEFMQSLAIGGIDGTIRGRFHGALSGMVRGKTGTLDGVSVLSGYVGERAGTLIFSVFMEGFRPRRLATMRQMQARIVETLMQILRAEAPAMRLTSEIAPGVAPGLTGSTTEPLSPSAPSPSAPPPPPLPPSDAPESTPAGETDSEGDG